MVSVDTVYRVLTTLLSKDNQGNLTPTEFNLLATNVQNQIFREYFEDENRDKIKKNLVYTGKGYSNLPFNQRQKINQFSATSDVTGVAGLFSLPSDTYLIEDDGITETDTGRVIEEIEANITGYLSRSLSSPSSTYPVYENFGSSIKVLPTTITEVTIKYLREPKEPKWTYTVVSNNELYDPTSSSLQHFELHSSEFSNIVLRMLSFFGIVLREEAIIKVAEELKNKNNLKDNQ